MEGNSVQPGLMFTSDPGFNPSRPVGRPSNPSNPNNLSNIFVQPSSLNPIVTTQSPSVFNPVQSPPISNPISIQFQSNPIQSPPVFNPSNPSGPFPFAVSSTGLYLFIYILCF